MDKWLSCIKFPVKRSQDDFGEEIEMKPIGSYLNKNYANLVSSSNESITVRGQYQKSSAQALAQTNQSNTIRSIDKLSELELLEHPITKAAINRGLVCRVIPNYQISTSQSEPFRSSEKVSGMSTGFRVDGKQIGNFIRKEGESILHCQLNRYARAEVFKQPETDGEANTKVVSRKLNQPEDKYHSQKDIVASKADDVQHFDQWTTKNKNQWVEFDNYSDLSVTYKMNAAVIEDSISLIDRRITGYGGESQCLSVPNRGGS